MKAVRHLIRVALAGLSAAAALPALAQTTIQVLSLIHI